MEVAPIVTIKQKGLVVADMPSFIYTSYQGKKVEVKVAVLKHGDDFAKVKVYDPAQFGHFEVGKKVLLSQYRKRDDGLIIILRGDKVFRCGCSTVDEKLKEEGVLELNKPTCEVVTSADVKSSPSKRRLSYAGIVQSGEMASPGKKVRKLIVKDEVGAVAVKLWNETASTEIAMGSKLQLNDVGVSFDKTENENVLHVNCQDQLLICEQPPKQELERSLIGISEDGDKLTLLLDDDEYECNVDVLTSGFDNEDLEEIMELLPFDVVVSIENNSIVSLKKVD